jgi:hypothetical protein
LGKGREREFGSRRKLSAFLLQRRNLLTVTFALELGDKLDWTKYLKLLWALQKVTMRVQDFYRSFCVMWDANVLAK